jgi:MFS family permease
MVSEGSGAPATQAAYPGAAAQPWPSRGAAYYGLAVIILATMLNFLDAQVFGMMAQRIKVDFHLTDEQLGFLIGPANVIFYVLVGIPMARLVDIYPRKIVLAGGITLIGGITALGGLAQNFAQLFSSRMLVGAGGSAHAPGAYSMLADYFPPARLPRAIGFLQLGFIGGNTLGILLGGQLIGLAAGWPVKSWMGLTMHGWQWVLMMVGAPGLLIAGLLLFAREPPRRGAMIHQGRSLPVKTVLREIWARKSIYLPLFIGLAFSATEVFGFQAWRAPFMIRTYGWNEAQIGKWLSLVFLVSSLVGVVFGTLFVEWLGKRYKDAHVRASTILFALAAPCEILAPLMPSGGLSLLFVGCAGACGLASAVPQNAAIQRITPNEMRGQVTAIYLFMFIVFGALGGQLIGSVTQRVFHSDADLWKSILLTASILMPLAAFSISRGIKPYGREVERLEKLEAQSTAP